MTDGRHSKQSPTVGGNHVLQAYVYANAAARTGATGFVSADIGKAAIQSDDNTLWYLSATTPTWVQIGGGSSSASGALLWGNSSVSSTTTTRYLTPGYTDAQAPTSAIQIRAPRTGTLRRMYVVHNAVGGNGNAIVYTLRVASVASALTVSAAANSTGGSDTTNSVAVTAGDLLDLEVTKASSVGSSPTDITVMLEYA